MADARDHLLSEIARMGGRYPVISSNLELRRDGLPYANQPEPVDSGVAVYFERDGQQLVFASDRWNRAKDNIRAVGKTIEAMRGIERWGASDMLERAFSAFVALPSPAGNHWSDVLEISRDASLSDIEHAYRRKAKESHPDAGGSTEAFQRVQEARRQALEAAG